MQLLGHRDNIIGKSVREAVPDAEGQGFFELLDRVYETGEAFEGRELPLSLQRKKSGPKEERFVDFIYQPIRDAGGKITGIFVEGYDVTDRHMSDERQKLLLRELKHRVKNLFAVAGGMVALSARSAQSPQEMAKSLRGRLHALSRANDLIHPSEVSTDEIGGHGKTTFDALARAVLLPYVDEVSESADKRASLDGPVVTIGADAATSLALILHETATNAAKYGALSTVSGQIEVEWRVTPASLIIYMEGEPRPSSNGNSFDTWFRQSARVAERHGTIARNGRLRLEIGRSDFADYSPDGTSHLVECSESHVGREVRRHQCWSRLGS